MSWQKWDVASLPPAVRPMDDIESAKGYLDEFGYVILSNHLTDQVTKQIRDRLADQAAAERAVGVAKMSDPGSMIKKQVAQATGAEVVEDKRHDAGEQFVLNLFNKGKEFAELLTNDRIQALIQHILGKEFRLSLWTGTIVAPGCELMGLHTDQWYINQPIRRDQNPLRKTGDITRAMPAVVLDDAPDKLINPAYAAQTIWMLSDFTDLGGATRIVPKSHRSGVIPQSSTPHQYRTTAAEGPAGSVLIYDARMWHSTGAHRGDALRYALHGTFIGPMIRPQENFFLSVRPDVLRTLPTRVRELIGYKTWNSYGTVDDYLTTMTDPDYAPMGYMSLQNSITSDSFKKA